MAKSKKIDISQELQSFLYINFALFILLISFFNLSQIKKRAEVKILGAKTDNSFWIDFVAKHPTYRDGWIELGRIDKIKEIDPNYKRFN